MKKKIAFLFPGQGAQYIGMGKDFYEQFSIARETFQEAEERLNRSLSRLIFEGCPKDLILTKNSQIAIYTVSVAIFRVIEEQLDDLTPSVCAGLSLGEYSALTAAKRLMFSDGVDLVEARGLYMHEASKRHPGTMAVCLNASTELVKEVVEKVHRESPVWIANLNCPGQIVISGTHKGVGRVEQELKARGVRKVLSIDVSGAFHSGLMEDAKKRLEERLSVVPLLDGQVGIVLNVSGDYAESVETIRSSLASQIVSPVLWEKSICRMDEESIDLFVEIGCGKTLNRMNQKIGIKSPTLSVERVEDLEQLSHIL